MNKLGRYFTYVAFLVGLCILGFAVAVFVGTERWPKLQPIQRKHNETPLGLGANFAYIIHGVVESAEDVGKGRVKIVIIDDADCLHEIILVGRAVNFYIGEYNEIIINKLGPRSWGIVDGIFLGEGTIKELSYDP